MIYPLGIPLLMLAMMYRYRRRLEEPGVRVQLGFLYAAFVPAMCYFDTVSLPAEALSGVMLTTG